MAERSHWSLKLKSPVQSLMEQNLKSAKCGGPIHSLDLRGGGGEILVLDVEKGGLDAELSEAEIRSRLSKWTPPTPRYTTGVMAKYAKLVSSASEGAVTR